MMDRLMRFTLIPLLALALWLGSAASASAQCPMCKLNVKASMESGIGGKGYGLNEGITYLLVSPYLLMGIIALVVYRNYRKRQRMAITARQVLG